MDTSSSSALERSGPTFKILYRVLLPKRIEVTNLAVSVYHAASRLEPTFMLLGGTVDYLAVYSIIRDYCGVQVVSIYEIQ